VENWGDDGGKVTDFHRSVQKKDGEAVLFSWVEWPSKDVRDASMRALMADALVMNISRASPAERRSASLLPSGIVRKKPMQVVKTGRVAVAVRMQHHAVRRRACLFVADIGSLTRRLW